jgi:3-oxoadipate enol-lactonase
MPEVISREGHRIFYDLHDFTDPWREVTTVVLQHGFGRSGRMWFGFIPHIARYYKIICPDVRGLGRSREMFDPNTVTVDNLLDDILRIVDNERLETFHYVGESLGGSLGFALAARQPSRIKTLSVIGSPLYINEWMKAAYAVGQPSWETAIETLGPEGWAKASNNAARFPTDIGERFLDWYSSEIGRSRPEILMAMARLASGIDVRSELEKISAPVLGIYPSGGRIATEDQIQTLNMSVKKLSLVRSRSAYQMVQMLEPAACANQILHFMSSHDGTLCSS